MSKDEIKPGEQLTLAQINRIRKQSQASAERLDGPTVGEYVAAGYQAANYPPKGYESRSTPEEIADAIAAQGEGQGESKKPMTIPQIKEALAAKGIEIPEGVTKRDDLKALLDAADEQDSDKGE